MLIKKIKQGEEVRMNGGREAVIWCKVGKYLRDHLSKISEGEERATCSYGATLPSAESSKCKGPEAATWYFRNTGHVAGAKWARNSVRNRISCFKTASHAPRLRKSLQSPAGKWPNLPETLKALLWPQCDKLTGGIEWVQGDKYPSHCLSAAEHTGWRSPGSDVRPGEPLSVKSQVGPGHSSILPFRRITGLRGQTSRGR